MTQMTSVSLDTVVNDYLGETAESVIAELTRDTGVTGMVTTENGPAGGNPIITFTGKPEELITVIKRYDSGDSQTTAYDLLVGLNLAVIEVVIPLDEAFAIGGPEGNAIRNQEILDGVARWLREQSADPRQLAERILAGVIPADAAHQAYYG